MNTSEIEILLEKFFEGNTSLQEEIILRDFFRGTKVPAHLMSHKPLFAYYGAEQKKELNDQEFERKLMSQLTENHDMTPVESLRPNRNRLMFVSGFAASILLLIGLFVTFQQDVFKTSHNQTINPDTEIAYADASEALMLVSGNLNAGLKQVERLQMVDKAMKNVQLLNKFYQYQTIIINPDEISTQSLKSK